MIITYERPTDLDPETIEPDAPPADHSPTGELCGAETYDVAGLQWHCTRAPHPSDDQHQAAFERGGDGPEGHVGFAWTYQYGTDDPRDGVDNAAPTHTLTVTLRYPDRAAHGIRPEQLAQTVTDAALIHFWEGDHDDLTVTVTTTRT